MSAERPAPAARTERRPPAAAPVAPQDTADHGNVFGLGGFDGALRPHGP